MGLIHGGQLSIIAKQYKLPESQWLDLSTGIAPFSYPITSIPETVWKDLPTISSEFIQVAQLYYQTENCWPLAGSQQLIEKLPQLWLAKLHKLYNCNQQVDLNKHVYLPKSGYKEHQHAWQSAGYKLHFYQEHLPTTVHDHAVVVVINPNNPRTDTFSVDQLSQLQKCCFEKRALLVLDEAFADIFPAKFSFISKLKNEGKNPHFENVIILRSIGKFFGLAGLRIGFVCSSEYWCGIIKEAIGPWSINGVALYVVQKALQDTHWQQKQIKRLTLQSQKQVLLLKKYLSAKKVVSNALFITVFIDNASDVYHQLCKHALYVRLTDEKDALRFGIADERQLETLDRLLSKFNQIHSK